MGRPRKASRKSWPPNLGQNPNGYYYYRNPQSGKKHGLGHEKANAFSEARAANAVLSAQKPSSLADIIMGVAQPTLAEWVATYRTLWIAQASPAVSTLRNQGAYLVRIASAEFAWRLVKDVTTVHVAKFLDEVDKESGPSTSRLMRTRLGDVFRMAITKGLIDSGKNPVSATYKAEYVVTRERLSMEQFRLIQNSAPPFLRNAMNIALLTGQRREDVLGLKFANIIGNNLFVAQGKSQGTVRLQIDMSIGLSAFGMTIADAVRLCRDAAVSEFIIHHDRSVSAARPGHPVSLNGLTQAFQRRRDALGILAADGRTPPSFHEIRSLSERLYREQYGAGFAQALLGHKNASMTATYDDLRGSGWQVIKGSPE